jgi:broad specificity phosphatase PhoE
MQWFERRPRPLLLVAAILVTSLAVAAAFVAARRLGCAAPTTLLVVRHADRAGRDDALSPEGQIRAAALARTLAKSELNAIYHSDTRRTRDTATPLAHALGLTPTVRPAAEVTSLVREIFSAHRGERVLVVGHGNTVPQIIAAAGGPELPDIAENEFDNLFLLTDCGCFARSANLVHLRYAVDAPASPP